MFYRLLVFSSVFLCVLGSVYAADTVKRGTSSLDGTKFIYKIFQSGSGKRRIEVIHKKQVYDGVLGSLPFRDRHLRIFKMVAGLIKESCAAGVGSLGNVTVSKDPEQDEDPQKMHPQYFNWEYSCK